MAGQAVGMDAGVDFGLAQLYQLAVSSDDFCGDRAVKVSRINEALSQIVCSVDQVSF
jgi:hypothetical protein